MKGAFYPLGDAPSQELPPTFKVRVASFGRFIDADVEYYLEATLVRNSKQESTLCNKKYEELIVTQPLCVQLISSPTPITDLQTKLYPEYEERIVSQHLVMGRDSKHSVGQRWKKILHSSQIPRYSFSLQLDFATVLQIGNPNTIPLRLGVRTIWKSTSEIFQHMSPMIVIKQFALTLLSTTNYTYNHVWLALGKAKTLTEMQNTSSLILAEYPCTQSRQKADNANAPSDMDMLFIPRNSTSPPIDLGIALGIKTPMSSRAVKIYPSFTTYNIKHEHHLKWTLNLRCAGEVVKYPGKQAVTVIGPSDDLLRP